MKRRREKQAEKAEEESEMTVEQHID